MNIIEILDKEDVVIKANDVAIIWTHSDRVLLYSDIAKTIKAQQAILQEARIFSKEREIHIYASTDGWTYTIKSDSNEEYTEAIEEVQYLDRTLAKQFGKQKGLLSDKSIEKVRACFVKYISHDPDTGQAFINNYRVKSISNG